MTIKRIICITAISAILPAISFAKQHGLAVLKTGGIESVSHADTTAPAPGREEAPPQENQAVIVKKVPKSRRQVKPTPLPAVPVKPVIRPKIIRPAVKVKVL